LYIGTIERCEDCPAHSDSDGICGYARWCNYGGTTRQICKPDYALVFPSWCPLKEANETRTATIT
jgi:hypothetical protein